MTLNRAAQTAVVLLAVSLAAIPAAASDLVGEALNSFPPQTARLEYSSPARLRTLPAYPQLRRKYTGPDLEALVADLAKLGVQEGDISEIVLGWRSGPGQPTLEGLASGHLDARQVQRNAAAHGIAAAKVGAHSVYCFGDDPKSPCMTVLEESLGAFGTLGELRRLIATRSGEAMSLASSRAFTALVTRSRKNTPIWGVATGPAVAEWMKGWMPGRKDLKLNWAKAFHAVNSLAYSIDPGEDVRLNMQLNCISPQEAANLRQVFDGLKLFQQVAWQNKNPGAPNPFEGLTVDSRGRQVLLALLTTYAALEGNYTP